MQVQIIDQIIRFEYAYTREWLGPGGLPGLQNRWRVVMQAAVGSTPIHSRLNEKRQAFRFVFFTFSSIFFNFI